MNKLIEYPSLVSAIESFESEYKKTSYEKGFLLAKMECLVFITNSLEDILLNPNTYPIDKLTDIFSFLKEKLSRTSAISNEFLTWTQSDKENSNTSVYNGASKTQNLFETAWTTYSDDVYDHSVALVLDRLEQSGFGPNSLQGKVCFDGGCGTGRLSIAMAKMSASKVVAADFGSKSLSFFQKQIARYNISNIETADIDVTDLSAYPSEHFDFVASNGVLHHTKNCLGGLDEHWRVVKPGGYLWLYLYGAGGFYWEVYDRMRSLLADTSPELLRSFMVHIGVREGLIYTMLDNFLAPREYYYASQILERLSLQHALTWKHQAGKSIFDDPSKYIATTYGKDILGPEGEVRLIIQKNIC